MKSVICKTFGEPETLLIENVESPQAGPGQLVVDMHAAAISYTNLC